MVAAAPMGWVEASAVAWPFVSDYAFAHSLVALPADGLPWRRACDDVHAETRASSLHEIELVNRQYYLDVRGRPFSLTELLRRAASELLRVDGARLTLGGNADSWRVTVQPGC